MTTRILLAGDRFVRPDLLADELRTALGDLPVEFRHLELPWPDVPFGPIADVDEASGTEDEMIEALAGIDVCVTQMAPLTTRILESTRTLRLFSVGRGGPVNANVSAATQHGVAVCFAPGRNATATAEHAVALMLAAARQIPQRQTELVAGEWRSDYYRYDQVGPELSGATVGLVGFGAIGSRVARIMAGFSATVIVFDPYAQRSDLDGVAERVDSLDELMARSQVVSVHARLTPETTQMIGAEQIRRMPPGGILINAARGGLVDYDAVCDALDDGHLYAAGFDVFPVEPLSSDHRLRRTDRVVMTPHLAGASKPTAHQAARIISADVAKFLRGEHPEHCANPDVLP